MSEQETTKASVLSLRVPATTKAQIQDAIKASGLSAAVWITKAAASVAAPNPEGPMVPTQRQELGQVRKHLARIEALFLATAEAVGDAEQAGQRQAEELRAELDQTTAIAAETKAQDQKAIDELMREREALAKDRDEARAEAKTAREHAQMAQKLASRDAERVKELEAAVKGYPGQVQQLEAKCVELEAKERAQCEAIDRAERDIERLKGEARTQQAIAKAELAQAVAEAQAAALAERRADLDAIAQLRQELFEAQSVLAKARP